MNARELQQLVCTRLDDDRMQQARSQARRRFSPTLSYGRHFGPASPTAKHAAVLIMLRPSVPTPTDPYGWCIPATVRAEHLPDHPGQVSLPGGRLEPGESHQQAAQREFCEELGLDCFPGSVLGRLHSLYVYNSDYLVTPFVAISEQSFDYRPCKREVASVIDVPLTALTNPIDDAFAPFSRGQVGWQARTIQSAGLTIWGATAIILGELACLIGPHPAVDIKSGTRVREKAGDS